jgi:glycosyltransferase involved in cell wall biosynthesis
MQKDQNGNSLGEVKIEKPLEVLHNCIDTNIFKKIEYEFDIEQSIKEELTQIPEKFCYLFVGHWLRGDFGEDRKNVSFLVKIFLETFKQVADKEKPALILKTSSAGFSLLDREEILNKINQVKNSITLTAGQTLPNIYLLHGELTDKEMNSLYNHPKVMAHVSFTKGEGFGRPLLEASVSGKPVIASGWSGQLDFLDQNNAVLVGGELKPIHDSSVWDGVLIKESTWFAPDMNQSANALYAVYKNYSQFKKRANILARENGKKFSYQTIQKKTWELLDKYVPKFSVQTKLVLPTLKKIN